MGQSTSTPDILTQTQHNLHLTNPITFQTFSNLTGTNSKAIQILYRGVCQIHYPQIRPSSTLSVESLASAILLFTGHFDADYDKACFLLMGVAKKEGDISGDPPDILFSDLAQIIALFLGSETEEYEKMASLVLSSVVAEKTVTFDDYKRFVAFLPPFSSTFRDLFERIQKGQLHENEVQNLGEGQDSTKVDSVDSKVDSGQVSVDSVASGLLSDSVISDSVISNSGLLSDSVISLLGSILQSPLSPQNLINLYTTKSGFSLRSLETKIFKWKAPTVLAVSGKRLTHKSIGLKKYAHFEDTYPRFFKDYSLREWQSEGERVTYFVFLNAPWRASSKSNFGDANTHIISLHPRVDYFRGSPDSVYFNSMGLGFGNAQPIVTNTLKRIVPGDVSLTIEPNLEYCVFRHVKTMNGRPLFSSSALGRGDFEDRFRITDIEVWGVGSEVELADQRREWEWEKRQAEARQGVNVRSMGEERAFLEMAGIIGNHQQ